MECFGDSQDSESWVGIWVATKTEPASYPANLSVVRFPFSIHTSILAIVPARERMKAY